MLARLNIGSRLGVAFFAIVILLIAASSAGWYGLREQHNAADSILDTHIKFAYNAAEIRRLTAVERHLEKEMFINVAFFDTVKIYKKRWDEAHSKLLALMEEGLQLAPPPELRDLYTEANKQLIAYSNGFAEIYQRIEERDLTDTGIANMVFGQFTDEIQQLDALAADIEKHAMQLMSGAAETIGTQYDISRIILLSVSAAAIILAIVLAVLITRSITKPLHTALQATQRLANGDLTANPLWHSSSDETGQLLDAMQRTHQQLASLVHNLHNNSANVLSHAHEVLSGSQHLATRNNEQADALERTAASMQQITAIVQQNNAITAQATQLAYQAVATAEQGGNDVSHSIQRMQELAENSRKINDIIQVIDSIAFQTNILALNASVEAARAGEHGRGFAVVASEVRTLATRSADSANEIRHLISDIGRRIGEVVTQAEHSGDSIRSTVTAIQRLAGLMQDVAAGTREQGDGIELIGQAIQQMDGNTRENTRLAEESRLSASLLEAQAEQLKQQVEHFQL